MKELNWNEIPFNPWLQKLHPAMLQDSFTIDKEILKGDIGLVRIKFGRDFVIQYIARLVIKSLMIANANEWQALASEAWRAYKDEEKAEISKRVLVASPNRKTVTKKGK